MSQWIEDADFRAFIEVLKKGLKSEDTQTRFLAERSLCLCFLWIGKYHTSNGQFILASESGLYDTISWLLFRDIQEAFGTRLRNDKSSVIPNVSLNKESVKFLKAFINWCEGLTFTYSQRTLRRMPSLIKEDLPALKTMVQEFESTKNPIHLAIQRYKRLRNNFFNQSVRAA